MAKQRNKLNLFGGPGDLSDQLWHYDGANSYREYGDGSSRGGMFSRGRRSRADGDGMGKLTQFMSAGGMRHENRVTEDDVPARRRMNVIRALAVFAFLWILFLFVAQ